MSSQTDALSNQDLTRIVALVRKFTGIHMDESKRQLISSRLNRRLRALQIQSFSAYCDLLNDPNSPEVQHFINAVTTNLTSFFREAHHFEYLAQSVVPVLRERCTKKSVRVWSAGCSTGAEPYSIAMTLADTLGFDWDWKILATDLDSNVLNAGRSGVYKAEELDSVPKRIGGDYFEKGQGDNAGRVRMDSRLRERIVFNRLNLMEPWPMHGPLDVIFCRNVAIYFDKPTQQKLFARFADLLSPWGTLFIGHSESLAGVTDRLHLIGQTTYEFAA